MRRLSPALMFALLSVLVRGSDLPFEIRREKLDNGLLVVAAQKEGLPVFEARVGFRSGSLYDASQQTGPSLVTSCASSGISSGSCGINRFSPRPATTMFARVTDGLVRNAIRPTPSGVRSWSK